MRLNRLSQLHMNMQQQGINKTRFEFNFRNLNFSIIYLAEQFPHELLFGCIHHNLFFVVAVRDDYKISTYLGENFGPLVRALGLRRDQDNPFHPNVFFDAFEEATPITTNPGNTPTIRDIAIQRRDVEEADKIYFLGWLNHDGVKKKPTEENLAKTLRICGHAVHQRCRRYHISSRWTDDPHQERPYFDPPTQD